MSEPIWIKEDFFADCPELRPEYENHRTEIEHLDGVPFWEAPTPPRKHQHTAQTRGYVDYFTYIERCACGAIGPWTASGVSQSLYRTPFIWRAILLGFLFGILGVLVLMFAPITLTDNESSCVSGGSVLLGLIIGGAFDVRAAYRR